VFALLVVIPGGCGGSSDSLEGATGSLVVERSDGSVYGIAMPGGEETWIGRAARFGGAWSADGTRVAVDRGETFVVSSVDGSMRARFPVVACYSPIWSPDADRLACHYTEPHWIKVMNADGSNMRRITPDCCYLPSWSPDGSRLAYVSFGRFTRDGVSGPSGVFVMNADGSGKRRLAGPEYDEGPPQWSPDGSQIAFIAGDEVRIVGVDGGNERRLLGDRNRSTHGLSWSPDGARLAATHGDGDFEIFVIDVASGEARNLTDNEGISDEGAYWSPDGRLIAFTREVGGRGQVFVVSADGGDAVRVTEGELDEQILHWSPMR
jgi:TolB protein